MQLYSYNGYGLENGPYELSDRHRSCWIFMCNITKENISVSTDMRKALFLASNCLAVSNNAPCLCIMYFSITLWLQNQYLSQHEKNKTYQTGLQYELIHHEELILYTSHRLPLKQSGLSSWVDWLIVWCTLLRVTPGPSHTNGST